MNFPILSVITFIPLVGAVLVLLIPRKNEGAIRRLSIVISFIPLILAFIVYATVWRNPGEMHFVEEYHWIPTLDVYYRMGVDGISAPMVLLTALLSTLSLFYSAYTIKDRVKEYYFLFLLLEMGMFGVFVSLDFIFFYVFIGGRWCGDLLERQRQLLCTVRQRPSVIIFVHNLHFLQIHQRFVDGFIGITGGCLQPLLCNRLTHDHQCQENAQRRPLQFSYHSQWIFESHKFSLRTKTAAPPPKSLLRIFYIPPHGTTQEQCYKHMHFGPGATGMTALSFCAVEQPSHRRLSPNRRR